MKVGQLSRKFYLLQVVWKSRKGAAFAMDNLLQPEGHCPAQSQTLNSFTLASANLSESGVNLPNLPPRNGHFTDLSTDIDTLSPIAMSSRVDRPAPAKVGSRSVHSDASGSSALQAQRNTERKNKGTEQDFEGGKKFKLSETSVLVLHQGDITKWRVDGITDAIVNAANERMLGGGGVDGAIHRAAGPNLLKACRNLPKTPDGVRCPVGSAVLTEGFGLPVSRIIHTVGPIYKYEDAHGSILRKAYESSLNLAAEQGIKYIAFPAISCGIYGYPPGPAAEVALSTIQNHSRKLLEIHFVLFEETTWMSWLNEANQRFEAIEI